MTDKLASLEGKVEKLNCFLNIKGFGTAFEEFLDSFKPKKLRDKINENEEKSRELLKRQRVENKDINAKKWYQQEL